MAIALAKELNTVIVSADSRQFYREMSIGTAKPTPEEQQGIPHYFIDSHSIHQPLSSANYAKEANQLLNREFELRQDILLVGGSGMFIDALCKGLDDIPHDHALRDELTTVANNDLEHLLIELREKDPVFYEEVDRNNPARIIRAIEAIRLTGKPYSQLRTQTSNKQKFETVKFVIDLPREILYERINQRVDQMLQNGLLKEVENLLTHKELNILRTVGYTEFFRYFDGEINLEQAIESVKQNTRRYAKRQLTWFRRDPENTWLEASESAVQKIIQHIELR